MTLGDTFHIGKRRRFSLGTHIFAGLNHWRSSYSAHSPGEGVNGHDTVTRTLPLAGGQFELGYRLHRRVGLYRVLGGPISTASSYAVTFFHAGLGLSSYLRQACDRASMSRVHCGTIMAGARREHVAEGTHGQGSNRSWPGG